MSFEEFKNRIREALMNGTMTVSEPMSDLDMAVQFAIGLIGDERGYPCDVTMEDLHERILTFADVGIFDRDSGWFYECEVD